MGVVRYFGAAAGAAALTLGLLPACSSWDVEAVAKHRCLVAVKVAREKWSVESIAARRRVEQAKASGDAGTIRLAEMLETQVRSDVPPTDDAFVAACAPVVAKSLEPCAAEHREGTDSALQCIDRRSQDGITMGFALASGK